MSCLTLPTVLPGSPCKAGGQIQVRTPGRGLGRRARGWGRGRAVGPEVTSPSLLGDSRTYVLRKKVMFSRGGGGSAFSSPPPPRDLALLPWRPWQSSPSGTSPNPHFRTSRPCPGAFPPWMPLPASPRPDPRGAAPPHPHPGQILGPELVPPELVSALLVSPPTADRGVQVLKDFVPWGPGPGLPPCRETISFDGQEIYFPY